MRYTLLAALALLTACSGSGDARKPSPDSSTVKPASAVDTVTATITYRQRMALPIGAHVKVSLVDLSRMDAAAAVISSEDRVTTGNQVPFVFSLPYVLNQIPLNARLAVQARIELEDKLIFTTTTVHPVVTQGATKATEVVLEPVKQ